MPTMSEVARIINQMPTQELVSTREKTHGNFLKTALVAGLIKAAFRHGPGYREATHVQREALDMIAMKLARIVCGDISFKDHWEDIAGYIALGMMKGDKQD